MGWGTTGAIGDFLPLHCIMAKTWFYGPIKGMPHTGIDDHTPGPRYCVLSMAPFDWTSAAAVACRIRSVFRFPQLCSEHPGSGAAGDFEIV